MPRRFTLAEAESLIPQVSRRLADAQALKADYGEAQRAIQSSMERIMVMGGVSVDRDAARPARERLEAAAGRLRESVERVQELGCVVKDLEMGLVDFPRLEAAEDTVDLDDDDDVHQADEPEEDACHEGADHVARALEGGQVLLDVADG